MPPREPGWAPAKLTQLKRPLLCTYVGWDSRGDVEWNQHALWDNKRDVRLSSRVYARSAHRHPFSCAVQSQVNLGAQGLRLLTTCQCQLSIWLKLAFFQTGIPICR